MKRLSKLRLVRRYVKMPVMYLRSHLEGLRHRRAFSDVEVYCAFLGYPRTGHTLIAALLTAHPEIVIGNELGAIEWMQKGFGRLQLSALILRSDRHFARRGFQFQGYPFAVPNQWQGRFSRIRVLGDKDGARTTVVLARHPDLLDRMSRVMEVPVRVIHVVRNPYDTLATFVKRTRRDFGQSITVDEALALAVPMMETVQNVMARQAPGTVLTIRHEDFVADPKPGLASLCRFLGVEPSDDYLEDCSKIVFNRARRTRDGIDWSPAQVAFMRDKLVGRFEFLQGYTP